MKYLTLKTAAAIFYFGLFSPTTFATTDAMEPLLGEMKWVAFNFAPRGWAKCDGQILPINNYQALFALLGTTYGGDGRTTFALPELRGRLMMHAGNGPGLSEQRLGQRGGNESSTLTNNELPNHSHGSYASSERASNTNPQSGVLGTPSRSRVFSNEIPLVTMDTSTIDSSGNNQTHTNMAPSNTLNCIIALQGLFPSRS
jgi:microcystin-dependent protein